MKHFLRAEGYEVDVAFDAVDAERKFAGLSLQLAIVDLLLSGGEGADLCRRLKARRAAPVLVVSALGARDAALAAGVDAFLNKPLDPLVLVSTVNDLVDTSAPARGRRRSTAMTDRIPSGDAKLDGVLGGGLPANSIAVVAGPPGSGKTILAHQYVFENATSDRPALYLTTVSEPSTRSSGTDRPSASSTRG